MGDEHNFYREIRRIQEGMDLLFNQFSGWPHTPVLTDERRWRPPTDVYETNDSLIIICEIAGMQEDDFEITIEENELTIRGERNESPTEGKTTYHNKEIENGPFERNFRMPEYVNTDAIVATYRNGFLEVKLRKTTLSRDIPIE